MTGVERLDARAMLDAVIDEGSWEPWSADDESVRTGAASVGGRRIALVVSEFGVAGGSIGAVAGRRIVSAVRRATTREMPLLAMPASGGTRMQEGTPAFLQMAAITAAVEAHREAGLLYLVYLRHPTTGGVFASWGSLGDVTWAQPDALVGFLGPKVYEGIHGERFPEGVQTSENLHRLGVVDDLIDPSGLGRRVARVLEAVDPDAGAARRMPAGELAAQVHTAWEAVESTRRSGRPGLAELGRHLDAVRLIGDGAVQVAFGRAAGRPMVVVGQDRHQQALGRTVSVGELRIARRGIALARRLRLPLVTVIDTDGGELSVDAEERGLARQIALCTAELLAVGVPTLSILLGQGTGGAALALFPADHTVGAADAWLSPLPPEGASVIMHGDTDAAGQMAADQSIWVRDLAALGIIDEVATTLADVLGALQRWAAADPEPAFARRVRV